MTKTIKLLNRVLLAGFIAAFILSAIFRSSLDITFAEIFIPLGAFIFSLILLKILSKLEVNEDFAILISIGIWLHLLGVYYFYDHVYIYDKIVHFVNAGFVAIIADNYLCKIKNLNYRSVFVFVVSLGVTLFEKFYEYAEDTLFNLKAEGVFDSAGHVLQSPLNDNMWDLIFGALGALFVIFIIYRTCGKKFNFKIFLEILLIVIAAILIFILFPHIANPVSG